VVPVAIALLAALSLLGPFAPVFDPWGWLVWGREIAGLELDTSGGPSWKPLPVVFTAAFAAFGDAAPSLWLLVARAGWLAAPVLAWMLAARLAPPGTAPRARLAAGAIAAAGVLLFGDPFTSWTRQFAGGLSEPLLVAVVLGSVERELAGRSGQALALGVAAALLRPEAWPFLLVYGVWLRRRRAVSRWMVLGIAAAVPLLWLVPDLIGSGDALTGADRAREGSGFPVWEAVESLGRSLDLALWALWPAAAFAVVTARRRGDRAIEAVAALGVGWIGVVAVMAAFGYAGLPRFAAPAAALACVLGAVGLVQLVGVVRGARALAARMRALGLGFLIADHHRRRAGLAASAAVAISLALVVQGSIRAAEIPGQVDRATAFGRSLDDLNRLVADVGATRLTGCGAVVTSDLYTQPALAWELDVALDQVTLVTSTLPRRGALVLGDVAPVALGALAVERGERLGRVGPWTAYALSCAPAATSSAASGARIAGVAGASR
jgi:hypothetical protein